jgi:integration host factor subunit alpha
MTLTKAELAEIIFEKVGLNKTEAKEMVEAFFEQIRSSLEKGESVKLSGFGNFELRLKSETSAPKAPDKIFTFILENLNT